MLDTSSNSDTVCSSSNPLQIALSIAPLPTELLIDQELANQVALLLQMKMF
jgi:hypothetical protein